MARWKFATKPVADRRGSQQFRSASAPVVISGAVNLLLKTEWQITVRKYSRGQVEE